ncbi:MAG: hypothetical protein KA297_20005 [Kofleriaceae bacterium]|nr:hypothetical protein [Kofleriaceae bacterium]MBP6837848.1 hypothetical protein [Kofleriaceae bacterium]
MRRALPLLVLAGCGRLDFAVRAGGATDGPDAPSAADARLDAAPCGAPLCADPSFGTGGLVVIDVGAVDNVSFAGQGLAVQPDDRVVVVGRGGTAADLDLLVVRLAVDGGRDPSFGIGGVVELDGGGLNEELNAVTVSADGSLLVAGERADGQALYARLGADGAPLGAGVVRPPIGSVDGASFNGVREDSAGRIWLGGQARYSGQGTSMVLARQLAAGGVDPMFGPGWRGYDLSMGDEFGGLMLPVGGGMYVVGHSYLGASTSFAGVVLRVGADGSLEPSFGSAAFPGAAVIDPGPGADRLFTIAGTSAGQILAGGTVDVVGGSDALVVGLTSTGALDPAFGAGGLATFDRAADEEVRALAVLADGRIVAGGITRPVGGEAGALVVLDAAGTMVAELDVSPLTQVLALAIDSAGRVVVLGTVVRADRDLAVRRFVVP